MLKKLSGMIFPGGIRKKGRHAYISPCASFALEARVRRDPGLAVNIGIRSEREKFPKKSIKNSALLTDTF
jgi:hypothetical protein